MSTSISVESSQSKCERVHAVRVNEFMRYRRLPVVSWGRERKEVSYMKAKLTRIGGTDTACGAYAMPTMIALASAAEAHAGGSGLRP